MGDSVGRRGRDHTSVSDWLWACSYRLRPLQPIVMGRAEVKSSVIACVYWAVANRPVRICVCIITNKAVCSTSRYSSIQIIIWGRHPSILGDRRPCCWTDRTISESECCQLFKFKFHCHSSQLLSNTTKQHSKNAFRQKIDVAEREFLPKNKPNQ